MLNLPLVGSYPFCDCPDFTGRQDAIALSDYLSLSYDREWEAANFGPKVTGTCKHCYALRSFLGQDQGAINDPRVIAKSSNFLA
jgi:hypothetical protein